MSFIEKILLTLGIIALVCLTAIAVMLYRRLKKYALGRMTYERSFSTDGIFVGDTIELTETVRNPTWFHFVRLRMDFYVPGGLTFDGFECKEHTKLTCIFTIPPFSTVVKKHTIRADKRSRYELFDASVRYGKEEYVFESRVDFYAFPDYFDFKNSPLPEIRVSGDSVSYRRFIEDPFFITGIREYRQGDPLNSINFKATARSFSGGMPKLMCNSYDSSRNYDRLIILDLHAYHGFFTDSESQIEATLRCACFLFCDALENGGRTGIVVNRTNDDSNYVYLPCNSGDEHIKRILQTFSLIDMYSRRVFSVAAVMNRIIPSIPNETDIFLITPAVDEKTDETIYSLRQRGYSIYPIEIGRM